MTVREREVARRGSPEGSPAPGLEMAVGAVLGVSAALTVVAFVPRLGWPADLAGAFRPHYAVAGAACLVAMAVARRAPAVAVAAGVVAANAVVLAPLWLAAPAPPPPAAPTVTVLWHNVNEVPASRSEELVAAIHDADADVVILAQVHRGLFRTLRSNGGLAHDLAYADDEGTVVWARVPVQRARALGSLPAGSRQAAVTLEAEVSPGRSVALLGMHTLSPRSPARAGVRDAELAVAASWAAAQEGPALVVGDLNTPPWSPQFRDLARAGGLRDSLRGHGLQPTWPARWGPAGVPIDHALHSPDLTVVDRTTGPAVGSLHRSVRVTLALHEPGPAARRGSGMPVGSARPQPGGGAQPRSSREPSTRAAESSGASWDEKAPLLHRR